MYFANKLYIKLEWLPCNCYKSLFDWCVQTAAYNCPSKWLPGFKTACKTPKAIINKI